MYAIVMTGGKQYKVEKGMNVVIEKLDEAGFICDGCLKFNEEQESTVKEIFEKFSVSDEAQ